MLPLNSFGYVPELLHHTNHVCVLSTPVNVYVISVLPGAIDNVPTTWLCSPASIASLYALSLLSQ